MCFCMLFEQRYGMKNCNNDTLPVANWHLCRKYMLSSVRWSHQCRTIRIFNSYSIGSRVDSESLEPSLESFWYADLSWLRVRNRYKINGLSLPVINDLFSSTAGIFVQVLTFDKLRYDYCKRDSETVWEVPGITWPASTGSKGPSRLQFSPQFRCDRKLFHHKSEVLNNSFYSHPNPNKPIATFFAVGTIVVLYHVQKISAIS